MAYKNLWRFLLIITSIAICSTQAQQRQWPQQQWQQQHQNNIGDRDEIIFPGPTERPARFPINRMQWSIPRTTRWPQVQRPAGNQPTTTSSPSVASTTPSAAYAQCFRACPATSEYNPICGTDNVDYFNPGRLGCAQNCGKQVEERRRGRCADFYLMRGRRPTA